VKSSVGRPPEGILLVDKPAAVSSHAVVARVRKALGIRKVGHAGTLDPDATGLLVVGVGRATRLLGYLTRSDKTYTSTIRLGVSTDTDDAAGDVLTRSSCEALTDLDVHRALEQHVGDINQIPSAVSAVKVDGRRAYARVRAGESVDLAARRITIHSLSVSQIRRVKPVESEDTFIDVDITVHCSAGTYIRAIARDAGNILGVGGHVVSLRRTAAGAFDISEAHGLEDIGDAGEQAGRWLLSMREAAARSLPSILIDAQSAEAARHGRRIPWPTSSADATVQPTALIDGESLVAIAEQIDRKARYLAVFD
jgi:tRNA pseudouridine55 synthase